MSSIIDAVYAIKVVISYDQESRQKRLVSVTVNEGWEIPHETFTVSDAEREIENSVDPSLHLLDLVHAIRDTRFMIVLRARQRRKWIRYHTG